MKNIILIITIILIIFIVFEIIKSNYRFKNGYCPRCGKRYKIYYTTDKKDNPCKLYLCDDFTCNWYKKIRLIKI